MEDWLRFMVSAAAVVAAGMFIGRLAGELGERLKLGRAWAGAVLISFATTLPELVTTLTVTFRGEVGIAYGGILGSMIFNLFILVVIDFIEPRPVYQRLSLSHVTTGLTGITLLGVVISAIAMGAADIGRTFGIGHVGMPSLVILGFYGLSQFIIFKMARAGYVSSEAVQIKSGFDKASLKQLILIYLGISAVIIVAAYHLGVSADLLAERYELGDTFAGATLLGIVTSLPEITNGIACARQKEYDLAFGNILGANAFVVVMLAIADICYAEEKLFYAVGHLDVISALAMAGFAVVMQSVALLAVSIQSGHRLWRLGIASIILGVTYASSLAVAYYFGVR